MVVHVAGSETDPAVDPGEKAAQGFDQAKSGFLASLNHEVRTPLSGIFGMLDLLLETELDEDQRDYLNAARLCTESLAELLNASLEYAALEAGQFTIDESEFSLRELLEAALGHHQGQGKLKRLRLSLKLDPHLPETMVGDAPRIREMLGHLIGNAIKFTHEGYVEVSAALAGAPGEGERLVACVRDSGIGIPREQLEGIFESFRQGEDGLSRSYPGLGLGLALAKKLSAALGGQISVESEVGHGSAFTVEIPLKRPAEQAPANTAPQLQLDGDGPLVLAVEDNPVGQRVLRHVLERRQLRVITAATGREAVAAARGHKLDLILMDLQMPDMNGMQAAEAIRKLPGYETVPILALTANCSDQVREECLRSGMQAYLSKPIDTNELWSAVTRYLHLPAAR